MENAYFYLLALSTIWTLAGIAAVWTVRRRKTQPANTPVSVLKPLCGLDPSLESNLRSFFEQDHDNFELIFGVEGEDDPAIPLVRRLRAQYPDVRMRLVVHEGHRGSNPKVRNLLAMLPTARHDVVLVSDSNVSVPKGYLREMCGRLAEPGVGLATSLIVGTEDEDVGSSLEALHLSGVVAAGIALPTLAGKACVIGKSMMFRQRELEEIGGLESVAHVLAEDFVLGQMYEAAGYRVVLSSTPVRNVIRSQPTKRFHARNVRWGMMRARLSPWSYVLEPIAMPLFIAALAPAFGVGLRGPLAFALGLTLLRDGAQWVLLRGRKGLVRVLPLVALRDLVVLAAWLEAPFRRDVRWRNVEVRMSAGTRLLARTPTEAGWERSFVEG